MNFRKSVFFAKDTWLNNGIIQKHLEDIRQHYFFYSDEKNRQIREKRLHELLQYARENVPFYRHIPDRDFLQFPIVNKSMIKDNYPEFIADNLPIDTLPFVTTSGSTGTPFKSYRDRGKILRHQADNIFFNQLAGAEVGYSLYYFRVWNQMNRKNMLTKWLQHIEEVDANDFTPAYVQKLVQKIESNPGKKYLLSYASSYEAMCRVMLDAGIHRVKGNVSCLISMSETLPEGIRAQLESIFQAPVVSRYSNMENGFIGQQCLEQKHEYHLNSGSFHVEILDMNQDVPVEPGQPGRIVITDLFNMAMPMIRYDTGDVGRIQDAACYVKSPVLSSVEGRRTDFIFSTSGQMLSPHIITNTMWKFPDIKQFQFIQKSEKEYLIKINAISKPDDAAIIRDFKNFLGENAEITVELVHEIPLLASGKRKKVVNEYRIP